MKAFLKTVAQDMLAKYGTNMSDIAVVFPNKRAALFLNTYLAQLAGKPIWTPTYITISDLFRRHSELKVADPIKSICDLHKVFVACTGIDETLDHFYGWGQLLLADFDDVDKNMVDAKADWLYNLPAWDEIFDAETKHALYLEQKKSGTVVVGKKIGRNDPCPCGSGKKYKKCCGKNA